MELRRRDKRGWFQYLMEHREFYDRGFVCIYLGERYTILFWSCTDGD
jgi:hypothetical protein